MLILGKPIKSRIEHELKEKIQHLGQKMRLAVLVVGKNNVTDTFVAAKKRFGLSIGTDILELRFPETVSSEELIEKIQALAADNTVSGIVVQLPLPKTIDTRLVLDAIPENKDVDLLSTAAFARFRSGDELILPPVVGAVREILNELHYVIDGARAVVVGQGALVGLPVSLWLRMKGASVAVFDEHTPIDPEATTRADILVSGAGVSGLITPDMITPHTILIDAGSSESAGKVLGDADPLCEVRAYAMTPVPGGVGPITVAVLFQNLLILHTKNTQAK